MSSRRRIAIVVGVLMLVSALPLTTPPALAFSEGAENNFFGTGAGASITTGVRNSFFGGSAGTANTHGLDNSFFGRRAGASNTFGSGNSFFGSEAGESTTSGGNNSFFGIDAGNVNTTASFNAFFGAFSGSDNTSGTSNAFFGGAAGSNNSSGSDNAFFGRSAGITNSTGSENAFFGHEAGFRNTTASNNAFFGSRAGLDNTTGAGNAFFGDSAGASNSTGTSNVFVGRVAGTENTTGNNNTFVGHNAASTNTTGHSNTFVGQAAGVDTTTGAESVFVGRSAGRNNTTGGQNAFFGRSAGLSNTTENANSFVGAFSTGFPGITNATAVGHRAQVSQSNALILGSVNGVNDATSNVDVGIGTTTPDVPLHVRRGNGTAKVLVEEASGTSLGRELFQLTNNGATRFRLRNTSNGSTWDFQSSGGGGSFVIDKVGGPASLDFELQPDGDAVFRGTATAAGFITVSDRNAKTDINPADTSRLIALLRNLDISTWRFKDQPEGTINLGPMAQDFHRLFGMGTETTIDVRDLAALALVGIQAQQERIDALEKAVGASRTM